MNPVSSEYYGQTLEQAKKALAAFPQGMHVGGGIHEQNAESFLEAGASHVIVTSYVFREGRILWENLEKLKRTVGKEHIVIDLSCREKDGAYYVVTDRWQKFTDEKLTVELLEEISGYCDEFLVHGVDVEGRSGGVDRKLAQILGVYQGNAVTYAGGIGSIEDLERFCELTGGKVDYTIGSALDIYGGSLSYELIKNYR